MGDRPRLGRPRHIDRSAIVAATVQPPAVPTDLGRWSCRELGAQLGVSEASVARVWREYGLAPRSGGVFAFTVRPELQATTVAVIGVCLTRRIRAVALLLDDADDHPGPAIVTGITAAESAPSLGVRAFLRQVAEDYAGRRVHVVVDSAAVRRHLLETGLPQGADLSLHFTLDTAMWSNLVEVWTAMMARDGGAESAAAIRALNGEQCSAIWVQPAAS